MSRVVVVFELKNRFIERFIRRCILNMEISFYAELLPNVQSDTYNNIFLENFLSVNISEAIFLSMFYNIVMNVYEGKTLINFDEIYKNTIIEPFLDKIAFKNKGIIDNVDSDEAYKLFNDINEILHCGIKIIVPPSFINEFIDCILDNKLVIDNLRDNGYHLVVKRSVIISYGNISDINSVYTYWNKYSERNTFTY